jgi:hypothetical protein
VSSFQKNTFQIKNTKNNKNITPKTAYCHPESIKSPIISGILFISSKNPIISPYPFYEMKIIPDEIDRRNENTESS